MPLADEQFDGRQCEHGIACFEAGLALNLGEQFFGGLNGVSWLRDMFGAECERIGFAMAFDQVQVVLFIGVDADVELFKDLHVDFHLILAHLIDSLHLRRKNLTCFMSLGFLLRVSLISFAYLHMEEEVGISQDRYLLPRQLVEFQDEFVRQRDCFFRRRCLQFVYERDRVWIVP